MFRKADRDRLERIDKNLVSLMTSINKGSLLAEEEAKKIDRECAVEYAAIHAKLDALLKAQNQDREAISAWIGGLQIDIEQFLGLLAVRGKENGLKKQVLKRKSGR